MSAKPYRIIEGSRLRRIIYRYEELVTLISDPVVNHNDVFPRANFFADQLMDQYELYPYAGKLYFLLARYLFRNLPRNLETEEITLSFCRKAEQAYHRAIGEGDSYWGMNPDKCLTAGYEESLTEIEKFQKRLKEINPSSSL